MKTKRFIRILATIILLAMPFFSACTNDKKTSADTQKYTCPMHPQIIKDAPGSCPICGMDLVPVNTGNGVAEITLSESQIQLANIKTMEIATSNFNTSKVLNARLVTNPELSEV
ncbi:MAG TPA: heavy metal-binding domain-containing protein, partial [Sphingobacteriaceae bacterium]